MFSEIFFSPAAFYRIHAS